MKILNSFPISSFGGINFVLEEFVGLGLDKLLTACLPDLAAQSQYGWKDILFTYWSIIMCGGDCAEDISMNLKEGFSKHPFLKVPSPDRLLGRLQQLAEPVSYYQKNRSEVVNEFSINTALNELNLKLLKKLSVRPHKEVVLDYDNTFIFTNKADAKRTYKKGHGYCPGVGIIDNNIVYVENRNGNCAPHTLQNETLTRMFELFRAQGLKVDVFRADSASYQFATIATIHKYVEKFFVKAKVNQAVCQAIGRIEEWSEIQVGDKTLYRGSTTFTPFQRAAQQAKQQELLNEYRLVVTKQVRDDRQLNVFTKEAFNYSCILTNDDEKTDDQVVQFYNQRGKQEREFDILKNDFIWDKMPFSKLEQNTVFLIITAICRNLYNHIITTFSKKYKGLQATDRIKKFIFRFICIPAKWVKCSRGWKLRLYGQIGFKT